MYNELQCTPTKNTADYWVWNLVIVVNFCVICNWFFSLVESCLIGNHTTSFSIYIYISTQKIKWNVPYEHVNKLILVQNALIFKVINIHSNIYIYTLVLHKYSYKNIDPHYFFGKQYTFTNDERLCNSSVPTFECGLVLTSGFEQHIFLDSCFLVMNIIFQAVDQRPCRAAGQ